MKNLCVNGEVFPRIFIKDKNTLVKYSKVRKCAWEKLQTKDINFINTPIKIEYLTKEEKQKYPNYKSKINLPILKGYDTLLTSQYTKNMDTENILLLYKKNVELLKIVHSNNIVHGDLFCRNIMINKELDINFIDFDQSIIDNYISEENVYFDYDTSLSEKKRYTIVDDKVDLFSLYLSYLVVGAFDKYINRSISLSPLCINYKLVKEIRSYLDGDKEPSKDYYFTDIVDDLLKKGYEAPKCKRK